LAIVAAFGPRGTLQGLLEPLGVDRLPSIYGFFGTWLTLTLFTYPYVMLAVRAALRGLDPALEEAARGLGHGRWRVFGSTTLPQLRPAIAGGALLAALYSLGDFGVPTLLRYDAFTRAVFVQYRSAMDRSAAAALALLLVVVTIGLLVVESRLRGSATLHRIGSGAARPARPVPLGRWTVPAVAFCALTVTISLASRYWSSRVGSSRPPVPAPPSRVSGSPPSTRSPSAPGRRWPRRSPRCQSPSWPSDSGGAGGGLAERVSYLGYALPGIVVALAFVAIGVRTPLHQTLALLVVAYAVRFLPEAVGRTGSRCSRSAHGWRKRRAASAPRPSPPSAG
jgi:iron(III) transport system permease protein